MFTDGQSPLWGALSVLTITCVLTFAGEKVLRSGETIGLKIGGVPAQDMAAVSGAYLIDEQGYVNMPNLGKVKVAGSTTETAQAAIEGRYRSNDIYTSPTIIITMRTQSGRVNLDHEVKAPRLAAQLFDLSMHAESGVGHYPWKLGIVSTVFWIGETGSGPTNARSAWNSRWMADYGGIDDPNRRAGFLPVAFVPRQSPFYVALPYCDMEDGKLKAEAARVVPWFIESFNGQRRSVCKDRWLAIRHRNKTCYAQWEDVGPFRTDQAEYVFGDGRPAPNLNRGAGIDVSPAVRDFLQLGPLDTVDWKFVDKRDVPIGPWSDYRQKAVAANRLVRSE
jgi:hypothetical protein